MRTARTMWTMWTMWTRHRDGAGKRLARFSLVLGLVAVLALWSGVSSAHAAPAATTTINTCDATTLTNAIGTAASGDTITFGCSGDIKLTQTLTIKTNLTLDGGGQSVTLDGGDSGATGSSGVRVLDVNSGVHLTLTGITVAHGNAGAGAGGGLLNAGGTITISNSTFADNFAGSGAALFNGSGGSANRGTITISNSTFTGNNTTRDGHGGGLFNQDNSTVTISNSTFADNAAGYSGGGLYVYNGTVTIGGSIVANNMGGNCSGTLTDQGYNLSSDSSCGLTGVGSKQGTAPQLASGLASNGGPTQTIALQSGSPAIDAIATSYTPSGSSTPLCPKTDQRGYLRPDDAESLCDMGAYESGASAPPDTDLALTNVPSNIIVDASSAQGAVVTYTAPTVVDEDNPLPAVSCDYASGSTFPIGTTTVTCKVTDSDDSNSPVSKSFTVTVNDTDLALTNVPSNIAVDASSAQGAVVTYTPPTATDESGDDAAATVSCTPASGSTFPIGTTTVTCTATDSDDTPSSVKASFTVTVDKASPTLTTSASSSAVIGATLSDSATLGGGDGPGGSITFYLFAPGATPTSGDGNNVFADTVPVTGDGTYSTASGTNSGSSVATALGNYEWVAVYSGDANNNSYASAFGSEPVTVSKADPSLSTTASPASATVGATLSDSATLAGGYNPTGTITFTLTDSSGDAVDTEPATVSGNGKYTTTHGYTATSTGTYQWHAAYSGDAYNTSASDADDATQEQALVNKANTTTSLAVTSPTQPSGLLAGSAVSVAGQSATLTATISPSPDGGTVAFTDGATTLCGNVAPSSGKATCATTYTAAGQHSITATYSGDSNYVGSASSLTLYVNTSLSSFPTLPSGAYNLQNGSLSGAYFVNTDMSAANGTNTNLSGANLMGANLSGANLTNAKLTNANLTNANLKGANLTNANLKGANLTGANLTGTTGLGSANLSGVTWTNTTCPDSTNSTQDSGTCAGHL